MNREKIGERTHQGACGNLGLAEARERIASSEAYRKEREGSFSRCMEDLLGLEGITGLVTDRGP